MTLEIFINDRQLIGLLSADITRSIEALCGTFNMTASVPVGGIPIKNGDKFVAKVNGTPVINGFVERANINYGATSHDVQISGRDKTCDIVDSSVIDDYDFKAPITLEDLIKKTLQKTGITGIKVFNLVPGLKPFQNNEMASAEVGSTVFSFLEKYARIRQVMLTNDGNGNVTIERASTERIQTMLINQIEGANNNILSSSTAYDVTQRFGRYRVKSQSAPTQGGDDVFNDDQLDEALAIKSDFVIDKEIRSSRVLEINAEDPVNTATANERAKWEANVRRARSITYNVAVQGFEAEQDGIPWKPNLLVNCQDIFAGINGNMLVKECSYNYSITGGSVTNLALVQPDSYTLDPTATNTTKKKSKQGESFSLDGLV